MSKRESKLFDNKPESVDIDLDISAIRKKRIRINHDDNKIIELNMSDLNIGSRLEKAYNKLNDLMKEAFDSISDKDENNMSEEETKEFLKTLSDIDAKMREQIDYIFGPNVSKAFADDGSMWDPIEGAFRYEHIIETLSKLYENNLSEEFNKMKARVDSTVQSHRKAASKYHR